MTDFSHTFGARENEQFAASLDKSQDAQRNWIVTIRFYSLLHYVEERLEAENYGANTHRDRRNNIKKCPALDDKIYIIYRFLEDLSRDSRYRCIRMDDEEVDEAEKRLENAKEIMGFSHDSETTKYST